jgi:hypothetical protein
MATRLYLKFTDPDSPLPNVPTHFFLVREFEHVETDGRVHWGYQVERGDYGLTQRDTGMVHRCLIEQKQAYMPLLDKEVEKRVAEGYTEIGTYDGLPVEWRRKLGI